MVNQPTLLSLFELPYLFKKKPLKSINSLWHIEGFDQTLDQSGLLLGQSWSTRTQGSRWQVADQVCRLWPLLLFEIRLVLQDCRLVPQRQSEGEDFSQLRPNASTGSSIRCRIREVGRVTSRSDQGLFVCHQVVVCPLAARSFLHEPGPCALFYHLGATVLATESRPLLGSVLTLWVCLNRRCSCP